MIVSRSRTLIAQTTALHRALLLSQGLAILFWAFALHVRSLNVIPVWYDQQTHFANVAGSLLAPYSLPGYVYPPWGALVLLPFSFVPLPIATLLQSCLWFGLLTALIFKYKGDMVTVLIVLCSFMAIDSILELNIDWIIAGALLLPAAWSLPLLLIKPQDALGVMLSYTRREWLIAIGVGLLTVVLSLLIWGWWPSAMLEAIQKYTLGRDFNIAPLAVLPVPIALAAGIALAVLAFRRRDPVLSVMAWLFFVPYATLYSLLIPFTMLAIKSKRLSLIISLVMWVVYGGYIGLALLHR